MAKDLTPEQIRAYRIADNKTAELAEWELRTSADGVGRTEAEDFDLGLLGFDRRNWPKLLDAGRVGGSHRSGRGAGAAR